MLNKNPTYNKNIQCGFQKLLEKKNSRYLFVGYDVKPQEKCQNFGFNLSHEIQ